MKTPKIMQRLNPSLIILLSFLLLIVLGTVLLKIKLATKEGSIALVDALFTATSAVCVTGLVVVDTGSYFTNFGKIVILVLIQLGGLGVMTISVALFRWMGRRISFKQRLMMQNLFSYEPKEHIFDLLKSVLLFTVIAEAIGAALLTVLWSAEFPLGDAIFFAIFHAISAFCNAGFSFFPDSFIRYQGDLLFNVTICALIVTGGIGFPVLYDLKIHLKNDQEIRSKLTLHSKTALSTTCILIVAGAILFGVFENNHLLNRQGPLSAKQFLIPVFQSITARTAGFNTVDIGSLTEATLLLIIILMFIGASPGSCGGGIKTTTAATLFSFLVARIRKHGRVNLFKKSIPQECLDRSISVVLLAILFILFILSMLLAGDSLIPLDHAEHPQRFLSYLFETVSAFGTVGLSMGVTASLSVWGKSWIILMMIVGRVGILTFAYVVSSNGMENGFVYSEEKLMIG
jgi:trk system potassium uptake protein TrkH